jgi:hypothetical protein
MSPVPHIRVALKGEAAKEGFAQLAYAEDWIIDEIGAASDTEPYEEVWVTADGDSEVHLVDDDLIGLVYIDIVGRLRGELADLIRSRLDTFSKHEVIDAARLAGNPHELAGAVRLAGVIATEVFDQDLFGIFLQAMENEDPQTRIAAIMAASYAEWREFIPLTGRLAQHDPDPEVRNTAADIHEGFLRVLGDEQP